MSLPNNENSPAESSDQDPSGADPKGLPGGNAAAGGSVTQETLDQLVMRRAQGLVDQNIEFLRQGRTDRMNPKLVQLLSTYDELSGKAGAAGEDEDPSDNHYSAFQEPKPKSKPSRLEEIGRQALQQEAYQTIRTEVETEIIAESWAEDVRALFAEFKDVQIDPKDPLVQKVTSVDNRQLYPGNRQGWRTWMNDANALRQKYPRQTGDDGSAEEDDAGASAAADADRTKGAATKRRPNVTGAGGTTGVGLAAVAKAAKDLRDGKIDNQAYLEVLKANRSTT